MKVLAIDYGTRRIGIAIGEDGKLLASRTLEPKNADELFSALVYTTQEEKIQAAVIGLPLRLNGTEQEEARRVRGFAVKLSQATKVPVVFIDERLTTEEAKTVLHGQGIEEREMKGKIDQTVAELLLEQYFRERR